MTQLYSKATAPMNVPGKPFTKGDARINRHGRPKSFDELRSLSRELAHEIAKHEDGTSIEIDGRPISNIEAILRKWMNGDNQVLQQKFVEIAYGKVPDKLEVTEEDGAPWTVNIIRFTDPPS